MATVRTKAMATSCEDRAGDGGTRDPRGRSSTIHLAGAMVLAAVAVACGNSTDSGGGLGGGSTDDGSSGEFGSFGDGGGGTEPTKRGCSSDMQNVVDPDTGTVVAACAPDQGCADGTCIAACDAARASHGSVGCDYVVPTPSFYPTVTPPCFAIFVANNWSTDTVIGVSRDGQTYDVTKFGRIATTGLPEASWPAVPATGLPPGKVGVLFMSADPSSMNYTPLTCPVAPAIPAGTAVTTTGMGKAWHVTTSLPVSAYDILPYGGAKSYLPSAELLLPTSAWGTNYYGIVPPRGNAAPSLGQQWGQIVAATDGTTIQILPNVNLPAGSGVTAMPASATATFTLNAGDFIQWQDSHDMSGSIITSNHPVAFHGGLTYDCYTSATSSGGGCDSAHQQIPPIRAFGSRYVGVPFATRQSTGAPESIPYRIVATIDGTALTFDPPIPGAPASLSAGKPVDFEALVAFTVSSQDDAHPIYLGQVMPGCNVTNQGPDCLGDEEYVNLLPPAQFLNKYIFFTDPTYGTTNLVFTRVKTPAGFQDVNLDCIGNISGWVPVGSGGNYEIANVDLKRFGVNNGLCDNGPHSAESKGPFGLMVWGLDHYASYAYPAGGNVATINEVVVPPIVK